MPRTRKTVKKKVAKGSGRKRLKDLELSDLSGRAGKEAFKRVQEFGVKKNVPLAVSSAAAGLSPRQALEAEVYGLMRAGIVKGTVVQAKRNLRRVPKYKRYF